MEPPDHFSQVVHKLLLVTRLQVVQPGEHIAAGTPRDGHPVGGRVAEGLEDAGPPVARCQQHPPLVGVPAKVPLPLGAPEAARPGHALVSVAAILYKCIEDALEVDKNAPLIHSQADPTATKHWTYHAR